MELAARQRGERRLHRRHAARHVEQLDDLVLVEDQHGKSEPTSSRCSGESSRAERFARRLEVRRAPRPDHDRVGLAERPGEREPAGADPELVRLLHEGLDRVVDLGRSRTPCTARAASSSASRPGCSSSRRYFPVSQPPASGLNAWYGMPCSRQSGITLALVAAVEQREGVLDERRRAEREPLAQVADADVRDAPRADRAALEQRPRTSRTSRRPACPGPARASGRGRSGRRRAAPGWRSI